MPPNSAAMELKVLINILTQGTAIQTLLNQTNQLSKALANVQAQAGGGGVGAGFTANANAAAQASAAAARGIQSMGTASKQSVPGLEAFESATKKAYAALKFLTGGFLALQAVRQLKGLADAAAQVEVLTTVLHVVAQNAGYTAEQIDKVDLSVRKLGITSASSKQSLTSFLQAKLPLSYAEPLARAAQDLAVISGMNSSDTFKRLIINIQQLDALGLRWMGLVIDRASADKKFQEQIGATTRALTKQEQQESLMVAVLEKAKTMEGAYTTAMGDAAKQIASLDRLTQDFKATLGESLLPAYSAIVRIIGTTFEKLQLLAEQFSENKQRAQEWADIATTLANNISWLVITIARHIDQIIYLTRLYIEFKLAIMAINFLASAGMGFARIIDWSNRLRLAWLALSQGTVGLMGAIEMLGAVSAKEAARIAMVAKGQAAVAATSGPATAGILATGGAASVASGQIAALAAGWTALASALAIPIIGYVIYKTIEQGIADRGKTPVQRAAELAGGQSFGEESSKQYEVLFRAWVKGLGDTTKSYRELRTEFDALVKSINTTTEENIIVKRLSEARAELTRLNTEYEEFMSPRGKPKGFVPLPQEKKVFEANISEATKKVQDLERQVKEAVKLTPLPADEQAIADQIDKVDQLKQAFDKIRDDPTSRRGQTAAARSEMLYQQQILEEMKERLRVSKEIAAVTGTEAQRDAQAAADKATRAEDERKRQEALITATQQMFGEKFSFTDEGITSGQFGKVFGGYQTLMADIENILKSEETIPAQLADRVKEALTVLGQAAQTPLDLSNVQKAQELVDKLREKEQKAGGKELAGTGVLGQQAVGLAGIGVEQARLAKTAELVSRERDRVQRFTQIAVDGAQRRLTAVQQSEAAEGAVLQSQYEKNLIGVTQYFDERRRLNAEEFAYEMDLREAEIIQAKALIKVEEDPKLRRAAEDRLKAKERARQDTVNKDEQRANELILQRQTKQQDILDQIYQNRIKIAGTYGDEAKQLDLANLELQKELNALLALGTAEADAAIRIRDKTAQYEKQVELREKEYQKALQIEEATRNQLDLEKQVRDLRGARLERQRDAGQISEREYLRQKNAQIFEDMAANRTRRDSQVRTLEATSNKALEDEVNLRENQNILVKEGIITQQEADRKMAELHLKSEEAIRKDTAAVVELDTAYENLATSVETYSERIRKSFEENLSQAIERSIFEFKKAGDIWRNMAKAIAADIMRPFIQSFSSQLSRRLFAFLGGGAGAGYGPGGLYPGPTMSGFAGGGPVDGPGTGTSDSILARVSAGEHIMPADKAQRWMPLLEAIRLDGLQSIAIPSVIPRRYASGGVVVSDGGAGAVQMGGGAGNMIVSLHPDALNRTMREWLEDEVLRQQGRR